MTFSDYLLNGALVALVLFQIRGRRLTVRTLVLPFVIVAFAAGEYLHGIPTAGNDLVLVVAGALVGIALGVGAGVATAVFRPGDGSVMAKAGPLAASLWVLGVGARTAFSLYATHGGGEAVGRFSLAHHITSSEAWVACLVLMALAEVVSRSAVMAAKYRRLHVAARAGVPVAAGAGT